MFFQFLKNRKVSTYIAILMVAMFAFSIYAVFIYSVQDAAAQVGATTWGAIKAGGNPWGSGNNNDDSPPPPPPTEVPMCACYCGYTTPMCPCP